LKIEEGLPKWAGGAVCGGTSLHSASCDQSHDSRRRMVQTECVILTQAAAEAGALPMCRAPVESSTSKVRWAESGGRPYWPGAMRRERVDERR
jgi:hypothetical protein